MLNALWNAISQMNYGLRDTAYSKINYEYFLTEKCAAVRKKGQITRCSNWQTVGVQVRDGGLADHAEKWTRVKAIYDIEFIWDSEREYL